MKTTNIINNSEINKMNVIETINGEIVEVSNKKGVWECAWKAADGKPYNTIRVEAKFITKGGMECYQGWTFNAFNKDEVKEFNEIGFKVGRKINYYRVLTDDGDVKNKFAFVD